MTLRPMLARVESCPMGVPGWREYETAGLDLLTALWTPPLGKARVQPRTFMDTERRDAVFPNWVMDQREGWGKIRHELSAKGVLVEFKNYELSKVGKEEVMQTHSYLRNVGKLGIMCLRDRPTDGAFRYRNSLYGEHGVVILFLQHAELSEMCAIKERGEDPADLILDMIFDFRLQHE